MQPRYRILFVCLGNICRSPAAEGVMRAKVAERGLSERFEIDSAGMGGWHVGDLPDNRMRVHARRRGYELTHRARQFRTSDFDDFDLIVAMDNSNMRDILARARTVEDERKVVTMARYVRMATRYDHIPDPYYEGAEGFELVLDLLEDGVDGLIDSVEKNFNA